MFKNSKLEPSFAAVYLCGGKGTRLSEITLDAMPKSLVRVAGVELLMHSIASVNDTEAITQSVYAIGHQKERIIEWLNGSVLSDCVTVEQVEPGVIGAIRSATSRIEADTYVICNTDEIRCGLNLKAALGFHALHDELATIIATKATHAYRHRSLTLEDTLVTGSKLKSDHYIEHPLEEAIVNTGMLIVDREGLSLIDNDQFGNDWSALINPLHNHRQLRAFIDPSIAYFNVGTPEELQEASDWFVQRQTDAA